MRELTPKERQFVAEFLVDRNGSQAAIRAGYSKRSARRIATRLSTKAHIRAAIDAGLAKLEEKTLVSAEYVIKSLLEVAERCRQAVPVLDNLGHPTGEWRFDSNGANRSLELLGKHLKLFTDRMEVEVIDDIAGRLKAARERRTNG